MKYRKTLLEQFESKYIPEPNSGCWLWIGALSGNGYGHLRKDNKIITAHRASYTLFKGEIPQGIDVCHTCDIRCCVNPGHLFLGTRSENLIDMCMKDRHNRKLNLEKVKKIKEMNGTYKEIAERHNVSTTMIYYIKKGIQWKY